MTFRLAVLLLSLATVAGVGEVRSQQVRTSVGTLRCTIGPGEIDKVLEPRELSCAYKPTVGQEAQFTGVIKSMGDPAPTLDKLVLVWSVYAPDAEMPAQDLEGEYAGSIETDSGQGETPSGRLIGGQDSMIVLQPFTSLPDAGPSDVPILLELNLKSVRA